MIHGVLSGEDELTHRDHLIALLGQIIQNRGQSLGGVEGGVVKENDGAGLNPGGHPVVDGGGSVVLPVQTINIPNINKVTSTRLLWKLSCIARML